MDLNSQELRSEALIKLSERQQQCLQLVETGLTSKEIGRTLKISPSTVDNHIQAACDRLGAKNRTEAARLYRASAIPLTSHSEAELSLMNPPVDQVDYHETDKTLARFLLTLPPIGGKPNTLPKSRRLFHIVQIALLAIAAMTAAILTIAGLVHVLSKP